MEQQIPLDETPIFFKLTAELYPEWFYPVETEKVVINGHSGFRLVTPMKEIYNIKRPPWL